jgi:hypothetical protein
VSFCIWPAEVLETDEALVEVDDDRENVKLALEVRVCSESFDIRETDLWRAIASYEFFLV